MSAHYHYLCIKQEQHKEQKFIFPISSIRDNLRANEMRMKFHFFIFPRIQNKQLMQWKKNGDWIKTQQNIASDQEQ